MILNILYSIITLLFIACNGNENNNNKLYSGTNKISRLIISPIVKDDKDAHNVIVASEPVAVINSIEVSSFENILQLNEQILKKNPELIVLKNLIFKSMINVENKSKNPLNSLLIDNELIGSNSHISILCSKKGIAVKITSDSFQDSGFYFSCEMPGLFQFNYPWKASFTSGPVATNIKIFENTNMQLLEKNITLRVDLTNPTAKIVPLDKSIYVSKFPLSYKIIFSKSIALSSFNSVEDIAIVSHQECLVETNFVSSKASFLKGYVDEIIFEIKNISNDCFFHPVIKEASVTDYYGNFLSIKIDDFDDKLYIKDPPLPPSVKILSPTMTDSIYSNPIVLAYYEDSTTFKVDQKISLHLTPDCSEFNVGVVSSFVIYPTSNIIFTLNKSLTTDGKYSFYVRVEDPLNRATCSKIHSDYNFYTLDSNDLNLSIQNLSSDNINELGVYKTRNTTVSFQLKTKTDFKNYTNIKLFSSKNKILEIDDVPLANLCLEKIGCKKDATFLSGNFKDDLILNFDLNLEKDDELKNTTRYFFIKATNLDGVEVVSYADDPLNIDIINPDSNFTVSFLDDSYYLKSNSYVPKIKITPDISFDLGDRIDLLINGCAETVPKLWGHKKITTADLNLLSTQKNLVIDSSIGPFPDELKNTEVKIFTKITDLAGNSICDDTQYITFYLDTILPSEPYISVGGVTTLYTKETVVLFDIKTLSSDLKFEVLDQIRFYSMETCDESSFVSDWMNLLEKDAISASVTTLKMDFLVPGILNLYVRSKDSAGNLSHCSNPFNLLLKTP